VSRGGLLAAAMLLASAVHAIAADPVQLFAAGSLRSALTEVASAFERRDGTAVRARFGPSGLLRDEIQKGAAAEVFASANTEHPHALEAAGRAGPVVLFARNRLCVLTRPDLAVSTEEIVDRMLDAGLKLGTSTPGADPSGDYTWELFRRIEARRPNSFAALDGKALKLTGAAIARPPGTLNAYAAAIASGEADLFVTYRTNAREAAAQVAGASVTQLPAPLAIGADYGLTAMWEASPAVYRFALFVMSGEGQAVLARHGFEAPALPARQP
jgi:ABC-type molybdate transport system substrate-binding protein